MLAGKNQPEGYKGENISYKDKHTVYRKKREWRYIIRAGLLLGPGNTPEKNQGK